MELKEEVVFVSSTDSALSKRKNLKLEDLLDEPFFLTEQDANYRRALDRYLASRELLMSPLLEISNTEFIIKMIGENKGLSFLPYFAVSESAVNGSLSVLDVADVHVSMYRQIFITRINERRRKWMNSYGWQN